MAARLSSRRLALLPFAAILLAALAYFAYGAIAGGHFDQTGWRDADLSTRIRADMVGDLVERHPLRGMTRQQVVALLGPPTPTDKWPDAGMVYLLGPDGADIDHEWLLLDLDNRGVVARHEVTHD